MPNPCLSCGACCATFRVTFYRGEATSGLGSVPEELVSTVTPVRVAMNGTNTVNPRCVALAGAIGVATVCTIHQNRPSTCREFTPSWEAGEPEDGCDRARLAHGLFPLTPVDWLPDAPSRAA